MVARLPLLWRLLPWASGSRRRWPDHASCLPIGSRQRRLEGVKRAPLRADPRRGPRSRGTRGPRGGHMNAGPSAAVASLLIRGVDACRAEDLAELRHVFLALTGTLDFRYERAEQA